MRANATCITSNVLHPTLDVCIETNDSESAMSAVHGTSTRVRIPAVKSLSTVSQMSLDSF